MSTKQGIFNYVTTTPENTNPAVVRSLLDDLKDTIFSSGIQCSFTFEVEDIATLEIVPTSSFIGKDIYGVWYTQSDFTKNTIGFPLALNVEGQKKMEVKILADTDKYEVTLNGDSVSYNGDNHWYAATINKTGFNSDDKFNLKVKETIK